MKHILDLPFGADELKEKFALKTIKGGFSLYSGVLLPKELRPYKSEDFSYIRWLEDEANAHVSTPDREPALRAVTEDQKAIAELMVTEYVNNKSGYILQSSTPHDHELTALIAVANMAKSQGFQPWEDGANKAKLLIVTSKSMVAHWRKKLKRLPVTTALTRPLIVTPNQLSKLLMAPAAARLVAKKSTKERSTARNGAPTIDWDFIIFDEPNSLGIYPQSVTAASAVAVGKLNKLYKKGTSPFIIFITKSLPKNPLHLALMSKILSPGLNPKVEVANPQDWGSFLKKEKFFVKDTPKGFIWLCDTNLRGADSKILTALQKKAASIQDNQRILKALEKAAYNNNITAPEANLNVHPLPISLRGGHNILYSNIWKDFRMWMNRYPLNTDPEGYARQEARYFWRVNDLKKDYILELIADLIEKDEQVFMKVSTLEAVEFYFEGLTKKKIPTGVLTAQNENLKEEVLEAFDEKATKVLIVSDLLTEMKVPLNNRPVVILTDIQMLPLFAKELPLFFTKLPPIVYIPYIEKTLEEKLHDFILSAQQEQSIASPKELEKLLRISAARTTPPNRMS